MTIVGFNFTKIHGERNNAVTGKVNIKNRVNIKNVSETDLPVGDSKKKGIRFSFQYGSDYEPDFGKIELEGDLLYLTDEKTTKTIMDSWKKDKKIPEDVMGPVINSILTKCNIQSLIVCKDVNLPPGVKLPKVQLKQ